MLYDKRVGKKYYKIWVKETHYSKKFIFKVSIILLQILYFFLDFLTLKSPTRLQFVWNYNKSLQFYRW